jgi:hypothetical protein
MLEGRALPSTLTVTNTLDSGPGSLRGEIAAAASGDTIEFAPSVHGQTITLTSGELALSKSLDIESPVDNPVKISGNHASRVFDIPNNTSATVTLSGLTITQGFVAGVDGGGIFNGFRNTLTVSNCTLSRNTAFQGGGIANLIGTLTVGNSRFFDNTPDNIDGSFTDAGGNTFG